jgi:CRP/FNR family cyclic AMP-dependent transcriptional regulator
MAAAAVETCHLPPGQYVSLQFGHRNPASTKGNTAMRKALLLLGILNDSDLDWLIATGSKRVLSPGTVLIRQGAPIDEVFLVLDGMLSVRTDKTGDADIARLRSGEVVGEMSFVDSRPPSASVFAIEPSAVLAIPRSMLQKRLDVDMPFAARFYRALAVFLSDRLRSTVGKLGYGHLGPERDDEIAVDTLDHLSLAGARFDWLQRRLKAV